MSAVRTPDEEFSWRPIVGTFAHLCPDCEGFLIDEHDYLILDCRCFTTREFFVAQDKMAVRLDWRRGAKA